MFIALSQESKSATFLQTDERGMAGIYEKKQKLFTRICEVRLSVCETFIASDMKVMFLLMHFNSNLYFKDLVKTDAHFLLFRFFLLIIFFFYNTKSFPSVAPESPPQTQEATFLHNYKHTFIVVLS